MIDKAHEHEAVFFFMFSLAFISTDEPVRPVFMPMRYQTLRNQKLEQLFGLELCKGKAK